MQWSIELLATAYHEAGHTAFVLRHGRHVEAVIVDVESPGEGHFRSGSRNARIPGLAEYAFKHGGGEWSDWRQKAFFEAAEAVAGPLAELKFRMAAFPGSLCFGDELDEYHAEDVLDAKEVILAWAQAARGTGHRISIAPQLERVEEYVRSSLSEPGVWSAIEEIARLLQENDGYLDYTLLKTIEVPQWEVTLELLDSGKGEVFCTKLKKNSL